MPAHRIARLIAVLAGLAGVLLCALVPLLPVKQTTATILWPQAPNEDGFVGDLTAPLVSGAPKALDVAIPCAAIGTLPADGGLVFSTNPPGGIDAGRNGLFVRANADVVYVAFRDTVAAVAPRAAVDSGACSELRVWADVGTVGADFVGIPGAAGTLPPDKRPQVSGVFTDLEVAPEPSLRARIDVDTRFITTPTALKLIVMVLGVLCIVTSIVALALLDRRAGRSVPRGFVRFWRAGLWTWLTDAAVIAGLLIWHVIGAQSSDDGYNTTIARIAGEAGYTANYYRYFGATEAPFDWYQSVLSQMASISTDSVWLRLPATAAAIATWLVVSRAVLPRLGRRVARNRVAVLTAGAVFLAAWLPFNNGLRPEPLIAFAVTLVWILVEQTVGTRRLWPYAVGIVVAVFSVTLAPQGLVALAPLLVGARPVTHLIALRRPAGGLLASLAPLAAAASLLFVVVFRDQTLATVGESIRIKYVVGPTIPWYQEFLRYYYLTVEESVDGSLARRFSVLILLLCLFGLIAVLLRRGSLPGAVNGPVWRLVGTTGFGLLLLTLTPTKWAVQFGAFAGLAGALGGVTAFAFARVGLHSRRNLALYVTALLFVLAWATSGINGWFYNANYGVPWFDKQPVIVGFPVTTIFLVLAIASGLLAGWLHFRMDYAGHTQVADTGRNRALASTPLLVVAVIMVVLELGSMLKATVSRYPVYTIGEANLSALGLTGSSRPSCGMADHVLVEADTNAGMLTPVPGQRFGEYGPLGGEDPVGFTPNGVSDTLEPAEPVGANPGTPNTDGPVDKPNIGVGFAAGTGGGYGPEGVNGSRVFLPFGLDPDTTPVMGSFDENTVAAKATSAWYQLPPRTPDRPLVTVAAAGAIWWYNEDGSFNYGQSLKLQWGVHRPDGSYQALGEVQPIDIFNQRAWRNLRFPLAWAPPEANVARIVADDPNLSEDQWFAFTPPRVPVLETADAFLGPQTPVLMDIATAANFPCQRPFAERLGIAELPEYRIMPNFKQIVVSSNQWQAAEDGGPFLFIQALLRTESIPTYLSGDWYRDWGSLERYLRVVPADEAPDAVIEEGSTRVFGWSRGGPIRALP
ncbi:arabinosyltransferase domain-containing protein [Mycolicibacterium sp. S2-37]|uniref:arabinosyltransferase domain-containing protein n=1 Tax=Mycolicibacterium sp. S2-37 TaxID=2810297 RepID=UPI001A94BDD4|nr:arabinosyltransferase domain-containing protein [Mycolicibacterium sp. S2-37]MBO0679770.1 arabinosyltransferase domain-containing protein [Mycolicibacterium sp. S2-37]MBO0681167.1 arabinosyltransferase domain-containing protein [Mycolicibacterium sp. S2-37]